MSKISIYIKRYFTSNMWTFLKKLFLHALVLTFVLYAVQEDAFESFGATKTMLFALCITLVVIGFFNAATEFHSQREYLVFDLRTVLPLYAWVISTIIIQSLLVFCQASITIVILIKLFSIENYLQYFITVFLILFSSDMLGFLCGFLITSSLNTTMSLMAGAIIIQVVLSGVLFTPTGVFEKITKAIVSYHGMCAIGSVADLNSYLPAGYPFEMMYYPDLDYIITAWASLLMLAALECALGVAILYFNLNYTEKYSLTKE